MTASSPGQLLKGYLFSLVGLGAVGAYFLLLSQARLIARDEGFYGMASSLVLAGKVPYIDFFYPQMPLLPYLYAAWMKVFGIGWQSLRGASAVIATGTAVLVFVASRRLVGVTLAVVAVLFFCSSAQAFPWFVVVQTYGLSVLFLLLAVVALLRVSGDRDDEAVNRWIVFAGVMFACAVNVRLFFAGLFPLLLLFLFVTCGVRKMGLFCVGAATAGIPCLLYALNGSFDQYWYNNLGFHLMRSDQSFLEGLPKKLKILKILTGFSPSQKFEGIQFPIIAWSAIALCVPTAMGRCRQALPLLVGGGIALLSLLPTPSYVQYFSACVPFLAIATVQLFALLLADRQGAFRVAAVLVTVGSTCAYLYNWPADYLRYTKHGKGVIGIINPEAAEFWNLRNLRQSRTAIQLQTAPGEEVFVIWPGLLVGTQVWPIHGLENHFGRLAASRLDVRQQKRYHVLDKHRTNDLIEKRKVRVAVIHKTALARGLKAALVKGGYVLSQKAAGVYIFVRNSESRPPG